MWSWHFHPVALRLLGRWEQSLAVPCPRVAPGLGWDVTLSLLHAEKRGFQPGAVTAEAHLVFLQEAVAAEKGLVLVCSAEKPASLPLCPFIVEPGN